MEITINGSNNTIIDFSGINTYGELKKALPSTGDARVPGVNQLRKKAKVVLHKETASGAIEIFDNGFFIFEECGCPTVFGVDRCERPETYSYSGKKEAGMEKQDFSEYPWELILEAAGSARLSHNAESREEYQGEISIDAPESENNIALSVRPEHEIREEEEAAMEWHDVKLRRMKAILGQLTEKQLEAITLKRAKGLTQEQIAEFMGISRAAVRKHLGYAEKKIDRI